MYIIYDNISILLCLYSVVYVVVSMLFDNKLILNDRKYAAFVLVTVLKIAQ